MLNFRLNFGADWWEEDCLFRWQQTERNADRGRKRRRLACAWSDAFRQYGGKFVRFQQWYTACIDITSGYLDDLQQFFLFRRTQTIDFTVRWDKRWLSESGWRREWSCWRTLAVASENVPYCPIISTRRTTSALRWTIWYVPCTYQKFPKYWLPVMVFYPLSSF